VTVIIDHEKDDTSTFFMPSFSDFPNTENEIMIPAFVCVDTFAESWLTVRCTSYVSD